MKENEINGLLGRKMRNRAEFQWGNRKGTEYLELFYVRMILKWKRNRHECVK